MFLVINASGKFWDGSSWSEQGKVFCTMARAVRSLHENGEDWDDELVQLTEKDK
jgi:hypothetical protein